MKCPYCSSISSKVIDKRAVNGRGEIRRRRECLDCSKRFTTYEGLAGLKILVVKKDGRREVYDGEKLKGGLLKALEKRPGIDKTEELVDKIERKLRLKGIREIPSSILGNWVLKELKKLDEVAYLRFASVYRTFSEAKDFERELRSL
ncbi:MAG: transcriptional repressor NrdR [Microgenomates group bacterium Gr01-1014_80]|nr:MAG: transcriptional repressor NrdR [Microgenomates group bacterium Gr01-1014_80]